METKMRAKLARARIGARIGVRIGVKMQDKIKAVIGPGALLLLLIVTGSAGCGQSSFIDVTLMATTSLDVSMSSTCRVDVSGAATESFTLNQNRCSRISGLNIGTFEYGTTAESGTLNFHVQLLRGDRTTLGQGDGSATIKTGGHQAIQIPIVSVP